MSQIVEHYLACLRGGGRDGAFFGLLEADHEILPELMAVFREQPDRDGREFLVEVIWQHGQPSTIPFLAEALQDVEMPVWKQALDGLVALASPAALEALRAARTSPCPKGRDGREFHRWLDEAIEQVKSRIDTSQRKIP